MNRYISFIFVMISFAVTAYGQEVKFRSSEFEIGVRQHLGMDDTGKITVQHTDTITTLDLSGLGISDIRDVEYLPKLRKVNLDFNEVSDVSPLVNLDSLRSVSLRYNGLQSIHVMAFANSPEMTVDVSFNQIEDFSCFNALTPCRFTVEGAFLQLGERTEVENSPGDVNGDHVVNAADVVQAVKLMNTGGYNSAADMNGNGTIDQADVEAIARMILLAE